MLCVGNFEKNELGLFSYVTYFKDDNGRWLKASRLEIQPAEPDFLSKIKHPKELIYVQMSNPSASFSKNVLSIMQARHSFPPEELVPLPFFFIEKKAFLRTSNWDNWRSMICPHGRLLLNYFDVYPNKKYSNLLYRNEHRNIENSKTLRFERELLKCDSIFFNKLILGTTLLPQPIAEALIENDKEKVEVIGALSTIWDSEKCPACLHFYKTIRKIRIVERYLFLRYQTVSLSKLS